MSSGFKEAFIVLYKPILSSISAIFLVKVPCLSPSSSILNSSYEAIARYALFKSWKHFTKLILSDIGACSVIGLLEFTASNLTKAVYAALNFFLDSSYVGYIKLLLLFV